MKIQVFADVGSKIDTVANTVLASVSSGYVSGVLELAKIGVVLYIIFYGYLILAGKTNASIMNITFDIAKLAFIMSVLSGAGGILNGLVGVVDELKNFFTGTDGSSYSLLDKRLTEIADLGIGIWQKADGIAGTMLAVLKIVGLLPLLLGFVSCGALIFYTEIVEKILLATAPIFIFCLMWGWLKDSFAQWVSAILGNALVLLFTSVVLQFSIELAKMALLFNNSDQWFSAIVMDIVAGFLSLMSVKWGREIGISLARVSADRAFNPKGAVGTFGDMVGAYKNTKNTLQSPFAPTASEQAQAKKPR